MINKIINAKAETLNIISGPTLSGKTRQMLNILKEAIQNQVPTLFVSLELAKEQVSNHVPLDEKAFVIHNSYVEDICNQARILKADKELKLILIDSLIELNTKQKLCLGTSDIRFHILKQLKQLANKLNVEIIMTGPANIKKEIKNINDLDINIVNLNSIRKHQNRF